MSRDSQRGQGLCFYYGPLWDAIVGGLSSDMGLGFVETGVSFLDLMGFFFILWLSWLMSRFVAFVLQEEVLLRLPMEPGVPYAIKTFTRYVIIAVGFIAAIAVLGIPLDKVTIMLSALGVGIGFGLQGLVNNVVSGFVLLSERPVRVRDKIEIEGILGNVSSIGIRASTIRTFDGAEVIVPNGDLISQRVVNWTLAARRQRVTIPVVEIPFPQRDLHLRGMPDGFVVAGADGDAGAEDQA